MRKRKAKDQAAQALARKRWEAVGKDDRRKIAMRMVAARKSRAGREPAGLRRREAQWRERHAGELQRYAGEWIVLEGETVVAHGVDPAPVVREARERGIRFPYIFFVEPDDPEVVRLGV